MSDLNEDENVPAEADQKNPVVETGEGEVFSADPNTDFRESAKVTAADRYPNGNLLPASEKRISQALAIILPREKKVSIKGFMELTGLGFKVTKRLRSSAIAQWKSNFTEDVELMKLKLRLWSDEMEDLDPDSKKVKQIFNTIHLFEKLVAIEKLFPSADKAEEPEIRRYIKIGPNMIKTFIKSGRFLIEGADGSYRLGECPETLTGPGQAPKTALLKPEDDQQGNRNESTQKPDPDQKESFKPNEVSLPLVPEEKKEQRDEHDTAQKLETNQVAFFKSREERRRLTF